MHLTPREMLTFGKLYLNGGAVDGRQVVPARVDRQLVRAAHASPCNGNATATAGGRASAHGYRRATSPGATAASSSSSCPSSQLVVVTTSDPNARRYWGHTDELYDIVENELIPAVSR